MKKLTKIALAAALTSAVALPATGALAASKTEKAVVGALLGAFLGAAVSNGDGSAVAAGAVLGAAVGASTAKDKDRYQAQHRYNQPPPPRGYNSRYDRYDNGAGRRDDGYSQRYDTRYDTRHDNGPNRAYPGSGQGYGQGYNQGYEPRGGYGYR